MKKFKEFFNDKSHWYHMTVCFAIAALVALSASRSPSI